MGTPHGGSKAANWASLIGSIANAMFFHAPKNLLIDLQLNSEQLKGVSEDFNEIVSRYKINSFYEDTSNLGVAALINNLGMSSAEVFLLTLTQIVDKGSATLQIPHEEMLPIKGDHTGIVKFGHDDERFKMVWKAIKHQHTLASACTSHARFCSLKLTASSIHSVATKPSPCTKGC